MDPVEAPLPHQIRCDGCSQTTPSYDIVHYGSMEQGYRQLCSRCFNTEVAQLAGLQGFEDAKFEAVGLADCTGELHEFHFRTHLFGTGVRSEEHTSELQSRGHLVFRLLLEKKNL